MSYDDTFLTSWGEAPDMPPGMHRTGAEPDPEDPETMTSWSRADRDGVEDERAAEDARQVVRDDPHLRNSRGRFATPDQVLRESAREERREREQVRQGGRSGKATGGAMHVVGKGAGAPTGGFRDAERRGLFRRPKKRVTRRKRTFVLGPFVFSRTTEREKGY